MSSTTQKVMVVDDELDMLLVCRMSIERCGYDVETFGNPLEALKKFQENLGAYFAVLSDIRMPKIDGIQLAKEIMNIKQGAVIILMTAFLVDEATFRDLPMVRKEDVIRKPFDPLQLCATIKARTSRS